MIRKTLFIVAIIGLFSVSSIKALEPIEIMSLPKEPGYDYYGLGTGRLIAHKDSLLKIYDVKYRPKFEFKAESGQVLIVSENGMFFATIDRFEDEHSKIEQAVTIYNNRRQPLWGTIITGDDSLIISPSGEYIVALEGEMGHYDFKLSIYHSKFAKKLIPLRYFRELVFSDDGRRMIIDAGKIGAFVFSENGEKILELDSKLYYCFGDSSNVAAFYNQGILEVYKDSELYWTHDFKIQRLFGFQVCESIDKVFLIFRKGHFALNMKTNQTIYSVGPNIENAVFSSISLAPKRGLVAVGVTENLGNTVTKDKRHVRGFLLVSDINRTTEREVEFRFSDYINGVPRVRILSDNKTILVELATKFKFIEIN